MSDEFTSAFDLVENDPSGWKAKSIKEDVMVMDMNVKRAMDAGLTPDDMVTAQAVRGATQAAASVLEKLSLVTR